MAPHEGEDDPAVYRSSRANAKMTIDADTDTNNSENPPAAADDEADSEAGSDSDDEDDALLTVQAGFNQLLIVLRDEKVMRFVKYVSASAPGSRWDVCGEYGVGMIQEDGDDESEEDDDDDDEDPFAEVCVNFLHAYISID